MKPPVVCFIPCCKTKLATGRIEPDRKALTENDLPRTWHLLSKGRDGMHKLASAVEGITIDLSSPETSAVHLYKGALYKQFNLDKVLREIRLDNLRLFIVSAWYGIVDASEPLHKYEAKIQGKAAIHWRNFCLDQIICDLLLNLEPSRVFGFFAGSEDYANAGAKYRYFFASGLNEALKSGLDTRLSGCFYRSSGRGSTAILGALGRTFMDFLKSGFSEDFVLEVARNERIDGRVTISFQSRRTRVSRS